MRTPSLALIVFSLLWLGPVPMLAGTYGFLTYEEFPEYIAITGCDSAASGEILIPATINGKPVTQIGPEAFYAKLFIQSLTLPEGITTIGTRAFRSCQSLVSIHLPDSVTYIGEFALSACTALTQITLPAGISTIERYTFEGCAHLTSIIIPNSVTIIKECAFWNCTRLESVQLSTSLTSIEQGAFSYCGKLSSVTIPPSVTEIRQNAFGGCKALTSLTLSEGLTFIGDWAFVSNSIESLTIPASVTHIGKRAFHESKNLVSLEVAPDNAHYTSEDNILFSKDKSILILYAAKKPETRYTLPAHVTHIGEGAFFLCTHLTNILIPEQVISIGDDAFGGCFNLKLAVFSGPAPQTFGLRVFQATGMGFKVYYFEGASGFTEPVWEGCYSVNMGDYAAIKLWLMGHDLLFNTATTLDLNNDGVSLLQAYAFALNPHQNLAGSMPPAVFQTHSLEMTYYAAAEGLTYTPQISTDLIHWTTEGISISPPDAQGFRIASAPFSTQALFMRLHITE